MEKDKKRLEHKLYVCRGKLKKYRAQLKEISDLTKKELKIQAELKERISKFYDANIKSIERDGIAHSLTLCNARLSCYIVGGRKLRQEMRISEKEETKLIKRFYGNN